MGFCPRCKTAYNEGMPQKDLHHHAVRNALVKDEWIITHDPYRIDYKGTRLFADLAAERPLAAQKGQRKIVVEIKVFATHHR
jgi:hypothetical protein